MVIALLSDSHGFLPRPEACTHVLTEADHIFFLGDGLGDMARLSETLGKPVRCVRGNCDVLGAGTPEERVEVLGGEKLLFCHGDRYGVKYSLMSLSLRAREVGARMACFGHTHQPYAQWHSGVLLVNPGSLGAGRYALVELNERGITPRMLSL